MYKLLFIILIIIKTIISSPIDNLPNNSEDSLIENLPIEEHLSQNFKSITDGLAICSFSEEKKRITTPNHLLHTDCFYLAYFSSLILC